ncbi:MAG: dihydropteroate synthase [Chthonomonadales bacterium]|nr:dihydropteroate synthase [Chthonomonadales bacterium]
MNSSDASPRPTDRLRELLGAARRGERTLVMGILNVTPDSFSDGGRYRDPGAAIARGEQMAAEGADIVDVGGESSRPGAEAVDVEEELRRVLPVVEKLVARTPAPISVDTWKAEVARRAADAGAVMLNDISALTFDPMMAPTAAERRMPVVLMHIRGVPSTMQWDAHYDDVVAEVRDWLAERAADAMAAGIAREDIVLDPGFGFGKTAGHNLELLRRLREIAALGYPVLSGMSRKSTIGRVLGGLPPDQRVEGTAAAVALSIANGAAIVRVHDVREMVRVARMADAVVRANWSEGPA